MIILPSLVTNTQALAYGCQIYYYLDGYIITYQPVLQTSPQC